mgnify:CR=1 FL=1
MRALSQKLSSLELMTEGDDTILESLHSRTVNYPAGAMVQREKGPTKLTRFVISGWALRFCTSPDGARQIVNFLLPGDSIGLYGALFSRSTSGVQAMTDMTLAEIPSIEMTDVFLKSARLGAALCWMAGQDERFLEQHIFRIGSLHARPRLAHLLVELQTRLLRAGTPPAQASTLPITQRLIAEALGISHVHANRCCRDLVKMGLIETSMGSTTLLESEKLKTLGAYDELYNARIPPPVIQRLNRIR